MPHCLRPALSTWKVAARSASPASLAPSLFARTQPVLSAARPDAASRAVPSGVSQPRGGPFPLPAPHSGSSEPWGPCANLGPRLLPRDSSFAPAEPLQQRSPRPVLRSCQRSSSDAAPAAAPTPGTEAGASPGPGELEEPLPLVAKVVHGFGRGSKQMGFATANMDTAELELKLAGFARGVYCGLAQVPSVGPEIHAMVCNIGLRPSFADGAGLSIEIHILHDFKTDFYGEELRVVLLNFLRPEVKFNSLDSLRAQIKQDIETTHSVLESAKAKDQRRHGVFIQ